MTCPPLSKIPVIKRLLDLIQNSYYDARVLVQTVSLGEDGVPVVDVFEGHQDRGAAVDLHPSAGQPVGGDQRHLPPNAELGPDDVRDGLDQHLHGLTLLHDIEQLQRRDCCVTDRTGQAMQQKVRRLVSVYFFYLEINLRGFLNDFIDLIPSSPQSPGKVDEVAVLNFIQPPLELLGLVILGHSHLPELCLELTRNFLNWKINFVLEALHGSVQQVLHLPDFAVNLPHVVLIGHVHLLQGLHTVLHIGHFVTDLSLLFGQIIYRNENSFKLNRQFLEK